MGLGISYYSGLKKIDCVFDRYGDPIDINTREPLEEALLISKGDYFRDRADELDEDCVYQYDTHGSVRPGSYSSYNRWRERLAELGGYTRFWSDYHKDYRYDAGARTETGGPFWELINFSDCEGTIGASVSKKLYEDFEKFKEEASKINDYMFFELYEGWLEAFKTASNNGAVLFH